MRIKILKCVMVFLFSSMLCIFCIMPLEAQYPVEEHTVGLWHLDNAFGTALSFDGQNDYVEVPYSTSLDITGEITIEAWVYAKGTGKMLKISCKRDASMPFYFIGVDHGKLYAGLGNNSTQVVTKKTTELPLNEWHFVAMSYSDTENKIWLYLDGELKEEVPCNISLVPFLSDLLIGAQYQSGSYYQFFDGIIDEVRISNVARSSFDLTSPFNVDANTAALWHFDENFGQIAYDDTSYYNDGQLGSTPGDDINDPTWVGSTLAIDSSTNANHGTLYGPTWVDGYFGNALSFNGDSDYVNIPDDPTLDITDDITLEAWFNISDFSTSEGYHMYILSKDTDGPSTNRSYGIGVDLTWIDPGKPFFIAFDGGGYQIAWGTTVLAADTWYHLMGVYYASTGDIKLYLNGVLESSGANPSDPINVGAADLRIGAREYSGHQCFFNGVIDEARISDVPIVPVEIDIKPNSYPNSINLGSKGNVPVAIFSTDYFDATTIDPTKVTLAGATVRLKGKGTPMVSHEDINGDDLLDLIVHIDTQAFTMSYGDAVAILTGWANGVFVRGMDTVRIVPEN